MPAVDIMQSVPATTAKETSQSISVLEEMIKNLTVAKTRDEANTAAANVASLLHGPIEEQSLPSRLVIPPTEPDYVCHCAHSKFQTSVTSD